MKWDETRLGRAAFIGIGVFIGFMILWILGVGFNCPDCPDAVVDTVTVDTNVWIDRTLRCEQLKHRAWDSIAVLNEHWDSSLVCTIWTVRIPLDTMGDLCSGMVSIAAVDSILLHGGVWTVFDGDTAVCFMWKTWRQWQQARGL